MIQAEQPATVVVAATQQQQQQSAPVTGRRSPSPSSHSNAVVGSGAVRTTAAITTAAPMPAPTAAVTVATPPTVTTSAPPSAVPAAAAAVVVSCAVANAIAPHNYTMGQPIPMAAPVLSGHQQPALLATTVGGLNPYTSAASGGSGAVPTIAPLRPMSAVAMANLSTVSANSSILEVDTNKAAMAQQQQPPAVAHSYYPMGMGPLSGTVMMPPPPQQQTAANPSHCVGAAPLTGAAPPVVAGGGAAPPPPPPAVSVAAPSALPSVQPSPIKAPPTTDVSLAYLSNATAYLLQQQQQQQQQQQCQQHAAMPTTTADASFPQPNFGGGGGQQATVAGQQPPQPSAAVAAPAPAPASSPAPIIVHQQKLVSSPAPIIVHQQRLVGGAVVYTPMAAGVVPPPPPRQQGGALVAATRSSLLRSHSARGTAAPPPPVPVRAFSPSRYQQQASPPLPENETAGSPAQKKAGPTTTSTVSGSNGAAHLVATQQQHEQQQIILQQQLQLQQQQAQLEALLLAARAQHQQQQQPLVAQQQQLMSYSSSAVPVTSALGAPIATSVPSSVPPPPSAVAAATTTPTTAMEASQPNAVSTPPPAGVVVSGAQPPSALAGAAPSAVATIGTPRPENVPTATTVPPPTSAAANAPTAASSEVVNGVQLYVPTMLPQQQQPAPSSTAVPSVALTPRPTHTPAPAPVLLAPQPQPQPQPAVATVANASVLHSSLPLPLQQSIVQPAAAVPPTSLPSALSIAAPLPSPYLHHQQMPAPIGGSFRQSDYNFSTRAGAEAAAAVGVSTPLAQSAASAGTRPPSAAGEPQQQQGLLTSVNFNPTLSPTAGADAIAAAIQLANTMSVDSNVHHIRTFDPMQQAAVSALTEKNYVQQQEAALQQAVGSATPILVEVDPRTGAQTLVVNVLVELRVLDSNDENLWWTVQCRLGDTVKSFRTKVVKAAGRFISMLYYQGRKLDPDRSLWDNGVRADSILASGCGSSLLARRLMNAAAGSGGARSGPVHNKTPMDAALRKSGATYSVRGGGQSAAVAVGPAIRATAGSMGISGGRRSNSSSAALPGKDAATNKPHIVGSTRLRAASSAAAPSGGTTSRTRAKMANAIAHGNNSSTVVAAAIPATATVTRRGAGARLPLRGAGATAVNSNSSTTNPIVDFVTQTPVYGSDYVGDTNGAKIAANATRAPLTDRERQQMAAMGMNVNVPHGGEHYAPLGGGPNAAHMMAVVNPPGMPQIPTTALGGDQSHHQQMLRAAAAEGNANANISLINLPEAGASIPKPHADPLLARYEAYLARQQEVERQLAAGRAAAHTSSTSTSLVPSSQLAAHHSAIHRQLHPPSRSEGGPHPSPSAPSSSSGSSYAAKVLNASSEQLDALRPIASETPYSDAYVSMYPNGTMLAAGMSPPPPPHPEAAATRPPSAAIGVVGAGGRVAAGSSNFFNTSATSIYFAAPSLSPTAAGAGAPCPSAAAGDRATSPLRHPISSIVAPHHMIDPATGLEVPIPTAPVDPLAALPLEQRLELLGKLGVPPPNAVPAIDITRAATTPAMAASYPPRAYHPAEGANANPSSPSLSTVFDPSRTVVPSSASNPSAASGLLKAEAAMWAEREASVRAAEQRASAALEAAQQRLAHEQLTEEMAVAAADAASDAVIREAASSAASSIPSSANPAAAAHPLAPLPLNTLSANASVANQLNDVNAASTKLLLLEKEKGDHALRAAGIQSDLQRLQLEQQQMLLMRQQHQLHQQQLALAEASAANTSLILGNGLGVVGNGHAAYASPPPLLSSSVAGGVGECRGGGVGGGGGAARRRITFAEEGDLNTTLNVPTYRAAHVGAPTGMSPLGGGEAAQPQPQQYHNYYQEPPPSFPAAGSYYNMYQQQDHQSLAAAPSYASGGGSAFYRDPQSIVEGRGPIRTPSFPIGGAVGGGAAAMIDPQYQASWHQREAALRAGLHGSGGLGVASCPL